MEFIKFNHIQNVDPEGIAHAKYLKRHPTGAGQEWVATEKIDGANFQFCTDGDRILCCSRNFVLPNELGFFHNADKVLEKYRSAVNDVHAILTETMGPGLVVRIYGEIFGGHYPGVDWNYTPRVADGAGAAAYAVCYAPCAARRVEPVPRRPVQKRVHYVPDIDFYLFSISVTRPQGGAANHRPPPPPEYLDFEPMTKVASRAGFPFVAAALYRGTFAELAGLSPEFPTTIPGLVGLPPIDGNVAEGFVLRPTVNTDPTKPFSLKLKSELFSEFNNGAAAATSAKAGKRASRAKDSQPRPPVELSTAEEELREHVASGLNENRFLSVTSKMEPRVVQSMDERRLASFVIDDVLDDLIHDRFDLADLVSSVTESKNGTRRLKSSVFEEAVRVVREGKQSL